MSMEPNARGWRWTHNASTGSHYGYFGTNMGWSLNLRYRAGQLVEALVVCDGNHMRVHPDVATAPEGLEEQKRWLETLWELER